MTRILRVSLALLFAASLAAPAAAQQVTQADIQRLQDNIYLAERDVAQLRGRDSARATQLDTELTDLKDELIYLKVKLRKERSLTRTEFGDVRDRIQGVRDRATAAPAYTSTTPATGGGFATGTQSTTTTTTTTRSGAEVPAGTELDVRLQTLLNSGTAQVEDRFEATTLADVNVGGRVLIPVGSVLRGVVTSVEPATRTNRTARMTVSFDQVTVNGRAYPMRGTVTQAIEGEGVRGEAGRAGAGAAVGAVLGAVLGGVKGAVIGGVIGGGGTIAATEGKEVELPQGTVLRVRVDSPIAMR